MATAHIACQDPAALVTDPDFRARKPLATRLFHWRHVVPCDHDFAHQIKRHGIANLFDGHPQVAQACAMKMPSTMLRLKGCRFPREIIATPFGPVIVLPSVQPMLRIFMVRTIDYFSERA